MNENNPKRSKEEQERRNRDPITGEPGSHPLGTGVGAAVGGTAGMAGGAAAGSALGAAGAGPIGAAVGAVAGAVAGGAVGHGAAETANPSEGRDLGGYIDYDVVDKNLDKVGTLKCLWTDHTGEPAFIGVQTGWLFGKTHVVPTDGVQVNDRRRHLRLPYTVDQVKGAPSYDENAELSDAVETEVYRHYGTRPRQVRPQTSTGTSGAQATRPSAEHLTHTGQSTPEQATIQLSEEELKVGKRQVEAGGVRLRKIIKTEVVNHPVEVQREEIVIERVPPGEAHPHTQKAFTEQEVYIPLRREEAVVEKQVRLKEEVRARKRKTTDQQQVTGEVRREEVEIQEEGEARRTQTGDPRSPAREIREREEQPRSQRRNTT